MAKTCQWCHSKRSKEFHVSLSNSKNQEKDTLAYSFRMTNKGKLTKILEQPHFPIHFLP
jgi:hypothetical protein